MMEKMAAFFEARLEGYDEHMLQNIAGAEEFYPFTASLLPLQMGACVLDLGCGTGLELQYYEAYNPSACLTGIDLSAGMLQALQAKFPHKKLNLIQGSYFDLPLGENCFDGAVSVESLHHFTQEEKRALYGKLHRALKPGAAFILTDYFALSNEEENHWQAELARLKAENGICDADFYHFDTPLTVGHEMKALQDGGFAQVEILKNWGATYVLRAVK